MTQKRVYNVDAEREGHVTIHTTTPDVSIWASCDLQAKERSFILSKAHRVLDLNSIPANTTIGTVKITNGNIEFTADKLAIEDWGWD